MANDVTFPDWDLTSWRITIPADAPQQIFNRAQTYASQTLTWYLTNKNRKASIASLIRAVSIVLAILGTLAPVLSGLSDDTKLRLQFTQWGVVSIALAGGLVLADKSFGVSGGWIRYVTTAAQIQTARESFNYDWAATMLQLPPPPGPLDAKTIILLLEKSHTFASAVRDLTEKETQAWAADFQASLTSLQTLIEQTGGTAQKAMADSRKSLQDAAAAARTPQPGAINVTIDAASKLADAKISVDDGPAAPLLGAVQSLRSIPPGLHFVNIQGTLDGKPFGQSQSVMVTSATVVQLPFKVPGV